LPETFCTVWGAVWGECRLAPGESLLVQGGSSGIGVTAIQMAAALGHPVFATAGSDAKCAACTELGATRAINYRTEDFVEAVKQATGGKGADVVLDMVGGDYVARELKAMADYGRLIFIAALGGDLASIHVHDIMRRRLQVTGSTLRARPVAYKAAIVDGLHRNVWPHFAAGRIRAVVDRIFPLQDAAQAHAYMATGQHIGKILLAVG
jgi:NADPH2:quinone reductase